MNRQRNGRGGAEAGASHRGTVTRLLVAMLSTVFLLSVPAPVEAADFNVNARTVGQFFEYVKVNGGIVPRRRVTQYVGLNGYDLLGDGENKLSFQTSLRFDTDLGLIDEEFSDAEYAIERRFNAFHLMYAYLEGRDLANRVSFKVGRQLHTDVLGWYDFDGVWLSVRLFLDMYLEVYGGLEVKQDVFVLNDAAFDPDGTSPISTGFQIHDKNVYAVAGTLKWQNDRNTQARVTYRRTFWNFLSGVETDKIGAYFHQRIAERFKLFGGAIFNFYVTDIEQAEGGLEVDFADGDVKTAVEYFRLLPVFDADSIFNVFDVRAYDDARARVGWQITKDLYSAIRAGVRFYGSDANQEPESELGSDEMIHGRLTVRWKPGMGIWTNLVHQTEVGLGGRKHYTSIGAVSPWYFGFWQATGSIMHVNFDADYTTTLEGNGFGMTLGSRFKLGEWGLAEVRAEEAINPFANSEFRLYAFLDLDYWF